MNPFETFPSPDGRFVLELHGIEMRMSHTVDSPYLVDAQTKKCLFSAGSLWDAYDVQWSDDSKMLRMTVRHYDNGTRHFSLALNLENETAALFFQERELLSGSLESMGQSMNKINNIRVFLKASEEVRKSDS